MDVLRDSQLETFSSSTILIIISYKSLAGFHFKLSQSWRRRKLEVALDFCVWPLCVSYWLLFYVFLEEKMDSSAWGEVFLRLFPWHPVRFNPFSYPVFSPPKCVNSYWVRVRTGPEKAAEIKPKSIRTNVSCCLATVQTNTAGSVNPRRRTWCRD